MYLRPELKLEKVHHVIEFNQPQCLKPSVKFNTQKKKKKQKKNGDNDGKTLYKSMKNDVHCKAMEKLGNRIDIRLVSNKREFQNGHRSITIYAKTYLTMI